MLHPPAFSNFKTRSRHRTQLRLSPPRHRTGGADDGRTAHGTPPASAGRRRGRGVARALVLVCLLCLSSLAGPAANKPERVEWFRDLGLGLFIHWSLDSQLTSVISHAMVGADEAFLQRYVEELPRSFNPKKFDPREWARVAGLAGFRYVVFTAKHHSGFCMFRTATTDFNIINTPFGRDTAKELADAFRAEGIAVGWYFSPDDFHFLHRQGTRISRLRAEALPPNNPDLLKLNLAQERELMTNYGPIDVVFFDPPTNAALPRDEIVQEMKELIWELSPDTVVTRGEIETPEQYTPGVPLEGAWEGNMTMGTQWQYRGTNEHYKSGTQLIGAWIETRAKGGNFLLNIGPMPSGELPVEQEARMREMALWNMVNSEAVGAVRPWVITNEGDIWFTRAKDADTVYAFVPGADWGWGTQKTVLLQSVVANAETEVRVLGQNEQVLEYRPDIEPRTEWEQTADGLRIRAYRAQRLYNDRRWPNPVVLKIERAKPGLDPPEVETLPNAAWGTRGAQLHAALRSLGDAASVRVGFEYRRRKSTAEMYEPDDTWKPIGNKLARMTAPGEYSARITGIDSSRAWEYRAVVEHPKVRLTGQSFTLVAR